MFGDVPIHMVGIVHQRKYDVLVDDWLIQYTNEEGVDNDLNNIVDVFEFVDVVGSILDIVQYLIG